MIEEKPKYKYDVTPLIQSHKADEHFDYGLAVDWAIDLIRQGKETDNVLMLASFSEPIDWFEIKPYVSAVLRDLGLEEFSGDAAMVANAHFHVSEIIKGESVRYHLHALYRLCNIENDKYGLMNFYLLYYAWDELDELDYNFYYPDVTLNNIEKVLLSDARKWIDKYILGIPEPEKNDTSENNEHPQTGRIFSNVDKKRRTFLDRLWFWMSDKQ